jgi:negative regulator of flagellin synthesis FlgM
VTNKINGLENHTVRVAAGSTVARNSAEKATAALQEKPAGAAASEVQITGTARNLAALEQNLRDAPAVDEARVAAIRRKLEDGSYNIDPMRIANKLLGLERDLGNKGS